MGRKKFYNNEKILIEDANHKIWNTSGYLRLSFTKDTRIESDSISSQRLCIDDYVNNQPDMIKICDYVDDGHTGLNTDRPSFNEMMDDVKNGRINCIVVKDLSRLGRYVVEIRHILEELLPQYHCRLISLGENLDSYLRPNDVFDTYIHFTQLVNEHSSIETSINTRMALDIQRSEGNVVSPFAPYGYLKCPQDKHKLIIDNEVSEIVKLMFKLSLSGMGVKRITQHLNGQGVEPPSVYKKRKGKINKNGNLSKHWGQTTVRKMLSNIVYAGHLEQKKVSKPNYLSDKMVVVPKESRFFSYNTHEPIISQKDYDRVQDNYKKCVYTAPNEIRVHLFAGLLRCMDCNGSMAKCSKYGKYITYKCRTYQRSLKEVCSHSHVIKHDELLDAVFHSIKAQIHAVANISNVFERVRLNDSTKERILILKKQIRDTNRKIESAKIDKIDSYKDWKRENITKEDYQLYNGILTEKLRKLELKIDYLHRDLDSIENAKEKNIEWFTNYMDCFDKSQLDREMVAALVDTIYIGINKNIKIVFKYADEMKKLKSFIEYNEEVYNCAK